jgi:hypothetical protein
MNIFYVDKDPRVAAENLVDRHVIKMILETAQLLSTAHRLLDGTEYVGTSQSGRKAKRWRLPDDRDTILYSATHINHPSAVWCRQNRSNYEWLFAHFIYLCKEYTYRYNNKIHKCEMNDLFVDRLSRFPTNLPYGDFTPVTPAMAEQYIVSDDSVTNYRNYYRQGKIHLHKWTKRQPPEWLAA